MFAAIECMAVEFRPDGVTTTFFYSPDDMPMTEQSWGMFYTHGHNTKVSAEIFSDDQNRGRYTVTQMRPQRKPLLIDRSFLIR